MYFLLVVSDARGRVFRGRRGRWDVWAAWRVSGQGFRRCDMTASTACRRLLRALKYEDEIDDCKENLCSLTVCDKTGGIIYNRRRLNRFSVYCFMRSESLQIARWCIIEVATETYAYTDTLQNKQNPATVDGAYTLQTTAETGKVTGLLLLMLCQRQHEWEGWGGRAL